MPANSTLALAPALGVRLEELVDLRHVGPHLAKILTGQNFDPNLAKILNLGAIFKISRETADVRCCNLQQFFFSLEGRIAQYFSNWIAVLRRASAQ